MKQIAQAKARIEAGLRREEKHLALVDEKKEVIAKKCEHIDSLQKMFEEMAEKVKSHRAVIKDLRIKNREIEFNLKRLQMPNSPASQPGAPRIQMPARLPNAAEKAVSPTESKASE